MRLLFCHLPLLICLVFSGCQDTARLDRLEADIRELKADYATPGSGVAESPALSGRIDQLENRIVEVAAKADRRDQMAYLRGDGKGSAVMQTDHGPFLIRLEGVDLNVGGRGYTLHLEIGNPSGLAVNQFRLQGDFGAGAPVLTEGADYSTSNPKIDQWLKTLKPFETRVTRRLAPSSWTPVDIVLNANSRDDLELMRFTMLPEITEIEGQKAIGGGGGRDDSFGLISVDTKSASILKTDYGAFLIAVSKVEPSGIGSRVEIQIGNPYGFDINQCRLVGDFGGPIPKRKVGEPAAKFQARLRVWTDSVRPFNAQIDDKISSMRWNRASFLVPGPIEQVKTLHAQLLIENVTLPQVAR